MKGIEVKTAEEMILISAQSMRKADEDGRRFSDPQGLLQKAVTELRSRPTLSIAIREDLECVERVMAHPEFKHQRRK